MTTTTTTDAKIFLAGGMMSETQKGKGIEALANYGYEVPTFRIFRKTLKVLQEATGVTLDLTSLRFPLFARPCPKTPRHGFVDSKTVSTPQELLDIWIETMQQDPEAEIMLMPLITAQWNAVLTPSSFTLGRGNDGATCGKNTIVFPLMRGVRPIDRDLLTDAQIDYVKDDPYIEAVLPYDWRELYGGNGNEANTKTTHWILTQLRSGPKVQGESADYIPHNIPEVVELIRPDGDTLLDWEERMKSVLPGSVVWHKGGSLTSHYAIHAQLCGVPFVTTKKPKVGAPLAATSDKLPIRKSAEVLRGVAYGDMLGRGIGSYNVRSQVILALAGLYNSHKMRGPHSFWIGVSASILLRLGTIALRGEARHLGRTGDETSRGSVYRSYAKRSLSFHATHSREWAHIFSQGQWNNHSIGGKKWAECAKGVEELVYAIRALADIPSAVAVRRLLMVLNRVVDLAHNNGWWLNKFANGEVYKNVQNGDLLTLLECGQLIPIVVGIAKGLSSKQKDKLIRDYREWKPAFPKLNMRVGNPAVDIKQVGAGTGLTIKLDAYDDILKDKRKFLRVRVPTEVWQRAVQELISKNITIEQPSNDESDNPVIRYGEYILNRTGEK